MPRRFTKSRRQGRPGQARKAMKEAVKEESEENVLGLCVRTFTNSSCLIAVLETSKDERAQSLVPCEKARDLVTRDFSGSAQSTSTTRDCSKRGPGSL